MFPSSRKKFPILRNRTKSKETERKKPSPNFTKRAGTLDFAQQNAAEDTSAVKRMPDSGSLKRRSRVEIRTRIVQRKWPFDRLNANSASAKSHDQLGDSKLTFYGERGKKRKKGKPPLRPRRHYRAAVVARVFVIVIIAQRRPPRTSTRIISRVTRWKTSTRCFESPSLFVYCFLSLCPRYLSVRFETLRDTVHTYDTHAGVLII